MTTPMTLNTPDAPDCTHAILQRRNERCPWHPVWVQIHGAAGGTRNQRFWEVFTESQARHFTSGPALNPEYEYRAEPLNGMTSQETADRVNAAEPPAPHDPGTHEEYRAEILDRNGNWTPAGPWHCTMEASEEEYSRLRERYPATTIRTDVRIAANA